MNQENAQMKAAREALRENIKRLARMRDEGSLVEYRLVHMERQLLFSLVHGLVCAHSGYSPMGDAQLQWADWYLDLCEVGGDVKRVRPFEYEEAVMVLILQWEMERCGRDLACGG